MNEESKSNKTNGHSNGNGHSQMVTDGNVQTIIGQGGYEEKIIIKELKIEQLTEKLELAYMSTLKDADEYNMDHRSRGKAIIFNNMDFKNSKKYPRREGSDKDGVEIAETLKILGYQVQAPILNPNLENILSLLENLSQEDHSDCDSLVIVVLSHGELGRLVDYRGSLYEIENLWENFAADRCPSLAGKPKIIIIQACSGERHDHGTKLLSKTEQDSNIVTDSKPIAGRHRSSSGASGNSTVSGGIESTTYTIPNMADFLIIRGSFIDHVAWRCKTNGSPFIQSLCKILKENSDKEDLLSMMTMVARDVALNFEHYDQFQNLKKQVPHVMSTLTRKVYFYKQEKSD